MLAAEEQIERLAGEGEGMSHKDISTSELIAVIRDKCLEAGSQKIIASRAGISPAYLSDVLCRRREISKEFAEKFGYEKIVIFRQKFARPKI